MIPKRIKMSGFLCYRDEQEIAFGGSSLWMLAGLNGSGKSSVFDAVTYALFGHHRGGSSGAVDLITKGESGFGLEFDFELDGKAYQAKRTLRKRSSGTAASQQLSVWAVDAESVTGRWQPIADTHLKAKYDEWIREHIGLNYETFTSSVLLLQGRAEKLLDSTAKGRAEVLAGIVDLERYQKLYEKADSQRKTLKGQTETLLGQWNAISEVTDFELIAVANRIEDADDAVKNAQNESDLLQIVEYQSRQWTEVQKKLSAAEQRRKQAGALVQEAAAIDKDVNRLRELRDASPHVETIMLNRTNLKQSEDATKQLADLLRETQERLDNREFELDQAKRKQDSHQIRIIEFETKQNDLNKKMPPLTAMLERIKQIDKRTEDLKKIETGLATLPADLPNRLMESQKLVEELTVLHHALPPLGRFHQSRGDLRTACEQTVLAQKHEKEIQSKGEQIRAKLDALRLEWESAKTALQIAQEKLASEKTLFKQSVDQADEFDTLEGAKVCRTCGQALTSRHHAEEKARREKERTEAEIRVKKATADWKTALSAERQLSKQSAEVEQEIQSARDEFKDSRAAGLQAQKDINRLKTECAIYYAELPLEHRERIAVEPPVDWLTTIYPTADDLESARRTIDALGSAKRGLDQCRDEHARWNSLNAQLGIAKQALDELTATLTADPVELRRQFHELEAEAKNVAEHLKELKRLDRSAGLEIDKFVQECQQLREAITERNGKLQTEAEKQKMSQSAIAAARKALSPDWQTQADRMALAAWNQLRSERETLEKKGVEARADQLRQARIELESLKQTLADLERERDQFPDTARRDPALVQTELKQARAKFVTESEELNAARNEMANLEERRLRRKTLRNQLDDAERDLNRYKLLAELLGRDRLQRHLVRQAERQIVDYANGVLDRLSEGQMMLRLCVGDDAAGAEKALELECYNRATGQSPINVAFLSGSQRFRVAVSLALGIGQYASRQHRPIESVIIDEGFGCLDRHGRQVMIQELQNLRGHLQCILLVSHQEEFAEAFADGYRFELSDGSTKVTRFQR